MLGNFRVIVKESNGGHWFAQGLEIDYAAEGTSPDDVKVRFERGLAATLSEHINRARPFERFWDPAPQEVWREVVTSVSVKRLRYSTVVHDIPQKLKDGLPNGFVFPYDGIEYLREEKL